jgi:hypothetical protein
VGGQLHALRTEHFVLAIEANQLERVRVLQAHPVLLVLCVPLLDAGLRSGEVCLLDFAIIMAAFLIHNVQIRKYYSLNY